MKRAFLPLLGLILLFCSCSQNKTEENKKVALMWFDAEANFARFSDPDSIDYYLEKIHSLGFTHAVVDIRPITSEVLFESEYAPRMEEWKGAKRGDFDYLERFITKAHALGRKYMRL